MAASRKEYELLMKLTAALGPNFNSTFKTAMDTTSKLQGSLQNLKKQQGDISAYQKTENHIKSLREEKERLENATERNEAAIDKVNKKLDDEERKLSAVSDRLKAAGIDTNNLTEENARLEKSYNDLKNAQEDYAKASAEVEKNNQAIAATRNELLKTVGVASAAVAAVYKGFVEPAASFQSEMSNIGAITGATTQELNAMADGMRIIAAATGTPLMDIASNAKMLAEAGGDVNLMMEQLTHGTNLANATQSDMATTLDFLGTAMKVFGIEAENTQGVVDSFAAFSTVANVELSQLAESFKRGGSAAENAGFDISDFNAFMAIFSEGIGKGGTAGTQFAAVLSDLSTPSKKAKEELERLEIALYNADGSSRDMYAIMGDLITATSEMSDEQRNTTNSIIFSQTAIDAWGDITRNGIDTIMELSDELRDSSSAFDGMGQAAGMAATQIDNFKGDSALAKAAALEFAITMGEMLLPAFRKVMQVVTQSTEKVTKFAVENKETIAVVAKVVAGLTAAKIAFLAVKLAVLSVVGVHKTLIATKAAYNVIQAAMNTGMKTSTALTLVDTKARAGQNAVMLMTAKTIGTTVAAKAKLAASTISSTAATVTNKTAMIAGTVAIKATSAAVAAKTGVLKAASAVQGFYSNTILTSIAAAKASIVTNAAAAKALVISKAAIIASTVATKTAAAGQWLLNAAVAAFPVFLIIAAIAAVIAGIVLLVKNWDTVKAKAFEVWESIKAAFAPVGEFFTGIWNKATEIFNNFMSGLRERAPFLASIIEVPINAIKGYIAGLKQMFGGIVDFIAGVFTGNWQRALDGVKNIFGGAFGALESLAKAPLRAVVTVINGVIGGLNKMSIPDWVPGIGGKGINIPLIPMFQKGSNYTPDTFIAGDVNGKGGELVTNARGYKVFTADETNKILDTISKVKAVSNAVTPAVSDSDTTKPPSVMDRVGGFISALKNAAANRAEEMEGPAIPALPSTQRGGDNFIYNDNTEIKIDGNVPGDLEEKLRQHKENIILAIKELLRKEREDEGRMAYA